MGDDKLEAGLDPLDDKMYFEVDPLHFQPQCNLTIIGIIVAKRTFFDAIDNFFIEFLQIIQFR